MSNIYFDKKLVKMLIFNKSRNELRFTILLIFISFFAANTKAQISVEALLDSTTILIGDQTDLHLRVTTPPNVAVQFPAVTAQELGDLEIIKPHLPDTLQSSANQLVIQQNITIAAFDSGFYRIPELPFRYGNQTLYSKPLELTVLTLQIDSTFVAPIKPIRNVPITIREIIGMLATFLAIAALVAALIWWLRRRNQKDPEPEPVYVPPAHVTALEKLNVLEKEKLWQQDKTKPYYTRLTYIFREYLENRYGVKALESTTDEILDWLKREKFSDDLTTKLRNTLQASDLVKFAKSKPGVDIHQNALNTAYEFIHATKKMVTEEEKVQLSKPSYQPTLRVNNVRIPATMWKRMIAFAIDLAICIAICAGLMALVVPVSSIHISLSILVFAVAVIAPFLYFILMEASLHQATLGKILFKMKVVDLRGERITLFRSIGRSLVKIISSILFGYAWAFSNADKKALHDIVAGTMVVPKER